MNVGRKVIYDLWALKMFVNFNISLLPLFNAFKYVFF